MASEKSALEKFGGFLGKAKDSITNIGETVASKSKEMVDVTKLSAQRTQASAELDEAYRQLGMVIYQKHAIDDEVEALFAKIADGQKKIRELAEQIEAAKANLK